MKLVKGQFIVVGWADAPPTVAVVVAPTRLPTVWHISGSVGYRDAVEELDGRDQVLYAGPVVEIPKAVAQWARDHRSHRTGRRPANGSATKVDR